MPSTVSLPSLPQHATPAEREQRQFQLSLARTEYNYMRSYLEGVPMSADLPDGEKFSLDFEAQVLKVLHVMLKNFTDVVMLLLRRELESDLPTDAIKAVEEAYAKLEDGFSLLHPIRDIKEFKAFLEALAALPKALEGMMNLPKDLERMATGLKTLIEQMVKAGPTEFLKSSLFDLLDHDPGRDYLQAQSIADYEMLFDSIDKPLMLTLPRQPWMTSDDKPCLQDWFLGWLQIAGFNTTQLRGVVASATPGSQAIALAELQAKLPLTDAILQSVTGDRSLTLDGAIAANRLYVCDYSMLAGAYATPLHGEQRYMCAPIAVFYWNPTPPPGYPPGAGAMQPVCIQLAQQHDPEAAPVYTPNDSAGGNDPKLLKWRIAKYLVNVVSAIQHEAVAHLGDCHLTVEPVIVAAHRQLSTQHPLLKLFITHFRFTININDDAIHSLIVPGGVVATNVGPAIECTRELVASAHRAWRWDENSPARVFEVRGVDQLPVFPFRDDTRLLWAATRNFVSGYLRVYYASDADVAADEELQGWVRELVSPLYCGFKGLGGLSYGDDGSVSLRSLDYLIDMVAHIVYLAGPQHASVNYAQYPLMSYMPSVAGTIYSPPPARSTQIASVEDCVKWYPPLDVALYTFSFEYLLSGVQYDTFGHYEHNPRDPYFTDPRVQPLVSEFQSELALIEIEIRKRNAARPVPYLYQVPSMIPNSISI